MKRILIAFILCSTTLTLFSQNLRYRDLDWEETPKIHVLDSMYHDESAVIIEDNRYTQIHFGGNDVYTYYTIHKIINVNTNAGIEKFNKVYIPVDEGEPLVDLKIRTISPENKVKVFNKDNLKKLENVDGYSNYSIFAVEGIEKGGEIEYTYTIKQEVQSLGREIFQRDVPIVAATFEIHYPERLDFSTKSYNGFPEAEKKKNHRVITAKDIPALTDEGYSSYKSKLMRVDFKIESSPNGSNLITWESIAQNLFETFQAKKGGKQAAKLIKRLGIKKKKEFEQIAAIEKEIKENFSLQESPQEDYENVEFVLQNRVGNSIGITKTYIKCFEELGVQYNIVLTSSRFVGTLDPDYPNSMDLRNVLFYLPKHDRYIAPEIDHMRFGPAPDVQAGGNGLFIETAINGDESVLKNYKIKKIEALPPDKNNMGMKVNISLNENLDEATLKLENFNQGYRAYLYRYFYARAEQEVLENFKKSTLTSAIEDANYKGDLKLDNEDVDLSTDVEKYFNIHCTFTSKSLVEKAGNDILISIGKVIGSQVEMYEEKKRVTDVILYQTKRYTHTITLDIPKDYVCTGLDQLKINNVVELDNKTIMRFVSGYTYENDKLVITINEDYDVLELDQSLYNEYRKVINSAADFNKIVLILESKK